MLPDTAHTTAMIGAAAVAAVLLAGCAAPSPAADSTTAPATSAVESLPPTWGSGPQAPVDPAAPAPATVAWTPAARTTAAEAAVRFMAAYARPGTAQPGWADALAPYASADLMTQIRTVDTAHLTTTDPATSGTLQADATDPYNGTVTVGTSEGPWKLGVHRQPDGSWRVASLQPPIRQGH